MTCRSPALLVALRQCDPRAADDNAAAAISLAAAEFATDEEALTRDLVVAIFDAEEPPHFQSPSMGSRRFWRDQCERRTRRSS